MMITKSKGSALGLAVPLGLALVISCAGAAWAGDSGDAASTESVTELKTEVSVLKDEVKDLKTEIGAIQKQTTVPPPANAAAGAAPSKATLGEKVGSVTQDVADIKKNLSDNLGVHIHGLVDGTYEYNLNRPNTSGGSSGGPNATAPGGRVNQLRVFDTDANGWSLEQFNLHMDRTADGGVGFVMDLNFGQVANVLRASTRESNLNPGAVSNDVIDLTQAYMTYTAPVGSGINLSLGRFVTLLGEETIDTYNGTNFNESRDFIFGFGIPFTHTGLRAQYTLNDKVGFTLGVNNGWDDVSDNNDGQSVEGQIALTANPNLSATITGMAGPEQVNHGNSMRWVIDPIVTYHTPITGLQVIGEYLYGAEGSPVSATPTWDSHGNSLYGNPAGPGGTVTLNKDVSWTAAAGYIVYDLNDNIEFATRGEWFRDADGARTGERQTLGEVTETLNYKVPGVTGLLGRLEFRHDESSAKPFFSNELLPATAANISAGVAGLPAHTYAGQNTLLAAAIYTF